MLVEGILSHSCFPTPGNDEIPGAYVAYNVIHATTVLFAGSHHKEGTNFAKTTTEDEDACVACGGIGHVKRGGNHVVLNCVGECVECKGHL